MNEAACREAEAFSPGASSSRPVFMDGRDKPGHDEEGVGQGPYAVTASLASSLSRLRSISFTQPMEMK
jgi:hypothetical protein